MYTKHKHNMRLQRSCKPREFALRHVCTAYNLSMIALVKSLVLAVPPRSPVLQSGALNNDVTDRISTVHCNLTQYAPTWLSNTTGLVYTLAT